MNLSWLERDRIDASDELLAGPIHGDLLGTEHLAARARAVARGQRLTDQRRALRPARLLARLANTRGILADAHTRLLRAGEEGVDAGPAAEWLLDNYHVVQEHLLEVRESLPGSYYRELPELAAGPLTGYPRVYEIAISLISHSEARINLENVDLFVEAFQSVTPLAIGELWAMPAMLRLGLIESIRRMALRTVQRLDELEAAQRWATHILEANAQGGSELRAALREFAEAELALTPHFVSQFLQTLRHAEGASPALAWLEQWLRDAGLAPENAVALSAQRLTLTQLMMANGITSLRDVGRRDWRTFVEHQSIMEATLREDPSGFYAQMTFATRDSYRHVVERIAKRTGHREASVAQWAVDLCRRSVVDAPVDAPAAVDARNRHVGYFLVDEGVRELEHTASYTPTLGERVERAVRTHPNVVFVGGLIACTMLATLAVVLIVAPEARDSLWLVLLFAFLPALDISVTVINQVVTTWLPPHVLPRLDLHALGVPSQYRTAVVIPTLFGNADDVSSALETVEVQFLANREAHLHFAILSDFTDAATEATPTDASLVALAVDGVTLLNARYGHDDVSPFHLVHRPRRWNAQQGVWMGWERKRGKLSEFNRLLRADGRSTAPIVDDASDATAAFSVLVGDPEALRGVKYVITLDADTVLPPDAAPSLIGALAHPLNRAVYDPVRQRIVHGYGILQPRVGVSLPSAHRSHFAAISSGHPGVDPYSTAVSDVYQDLYGEGSYTGKGIYDVDAFELATHGRFPENTLLSHDLIEGNYARAGLATDVIVYDDYPSSYVAYTRRKHRWIRGDWQLLPWLGPTVPSTHGTEPNRLSLLSRWKLLDNMRRSTVELAQLAFLLAAWTVLPGSVVRWTMLALGAIVAPWATALALALVRPPRDKSWRAYYGAVAQDAVVSTQQAALALAFLLHQTLISIDAIVRTLYRLYISRRQLLEWRSASTVERGVGDIGQETWTAMRLSVLVTLGIAAAIAYRRIESQMARGAPLESLLLSELLLGSIVLLWIMAPRLAAYLSEQRIKARPVLSTADRETARRYAGLHWRFFDRFVNASTHWLAPDNVQFDPEFVVAMRTSPTNIGLQLLSTVSAHDLGLLTSAELTTRLEQTFGTLQRLRRHKGHFFNWYDLNDLRVLEPAYISTVDSGNIAGHLVAIRQACLDLAAREPSLDGRLLPLAEQADAYVSEMDFGFLYDVKRKLFTIGYHTESLTADDSFYDLLASEARLASFVAIAKNDVPVEHWFRLARPLNRTSSATALVSWSGSMFEYLMPLLVMRSLPFTILDQTYHGVVARHVAHGRKHHTPWGVSESAYNVRDLHLTYQYRAFGIADLALKRGLERDVVIAPYATALAALVDPARAFENLRRLESMGALGEFGFADALDYTRATPGERFALVNTSMAHHVGMTVVALTNLLKGDIWQDRFHAAPLVQSAQLLLHERIPRRLLLREAQSPRIPAERSASSGDQPVVREVDSTTRTKPRVAMLGALPYTVMLNHNGSGYSRYESLAVTRWRADSTRDDLGQYCYVREVDSGRTWSTSHQPVCAPTNHSKVWLASDRVTMHRVDGDIETRTEITVVAADCAEVRRVTLINLGSEPCDIELTSYGEIVMAPVDADRAHPAFSNLFVETEWHAWCTAITATRRPRSPDDPELWCVHVVDAGPDRIGDVTCETDRSAFLGRGRGVRHPAAMQTDGALSGTTGPVLDPIFALRTRVRVTPGRAVSVAFTTLVATSRKAAFELAGRYHDDHAAQRALDFAWTSTQLELRELGITPASAATFQEIAAQLLFRDGSLAPPPDEIRRNRGSQPQLWMYGISGDRPIVLATIDAMDGLPTLRELLVAHRFWTRHALTVDLVIINASGHDYLQELRDAITEAVISTNDAALIDKPGGVFVRRLDGFSEVDYLMLSATSRVHLTCDGRSLTRILESVALQASDRQRTASQSLAARTLERSTPSSASIGIMPTDRPGPIASLVSALRPLVAPLMPRSARAKAEPERAESLHTLRLFDNGIGSFDQRGDYLIKVDDDQLPPAPWSNVIGNPHGGFLVTERGAGCMWAENAFFYRVTPWHNDPVTDPTSDVLFLKDLDTGSLWSATPAPIDDGHYLVRHGAGASTFEHEHDGIHTVLHLGMPDHAAVKLSRLRITNRSNESRRLSVTAFVEWTLGSRREDTQHQVRTRFAPEQQAMLAQNTFDAQFAEWTAFLAVSEPVSSYSANRRSFLGRNGSLADPAALRMDSLDGMTGVALDPCAALQFELVVLPGESREISVVLGAARTEAAARQLADRLRTVLGATAAAHRTVDAWDARLSAITVKTPDLSFDLLINKWSLYQALSCRMWARMGLYQSSGAYGFRDQLQDVMAFLYAEPGVAREHILRAASRQFIEGDVQHWWHPHSGRGVRTRFSDDLVWLPYVVDQYMRVTGDATVLDEYVPFLSMRELLPHEHEIYDLPTVTEDFGSVYEHCRRALRRACTVGVHGLPLIGTGDWNDGMSRVGADGKGESVWLAWFLVTTLRTFATHAEAHGDHGEALDMRRKADAYVLAVEANGWDGGWYRRAYYDDGTPMGSSESTECRIDSIAQSWSVISGAGNTARQRMAMKALNEQLVLDDARLIMLLTPPFNEGTHDPGYIAGYVPGVRENGAQYTHAALWAVLATAMHGDGERAFTLFQMLNPLTHTQSAEGVARYKVEPYVVAADVYTAPTLLGRGGWTWYTGSASWMYRVGLENILGFTKIGDTLRIEPCVPRDWQEFSITYRFGNSTYEIVVRNPAQLRQRGSRVMLDGTLFRTNTIPLVDDGQVHHVVVDMATRR
ncbi:GH36-type glycosyl hydrolase domain-containing protein [Gemmatimonas sp.]|uniref:GH36-type glycosyl hydrolase domain-containing protein n=1 Tax=Gemmatimonas sp. TaxID=1962908 RepID=UPI003982F64F